MEFFFPDSQDLVDPSFDFLTESRDEFRLRQRDDLYAHELFEVPPFDGILVSKAIVDGSGTASGKYTLAQRHRLFRLGIHQFLRADNHCGKNPLKIMGDCGAFTYKDEEEPPFSVEEIIKFYDACDFDLGISLDHAILAFNAEWDTHLPGFDPVAPEVKARQDLTLTHAQKFWDVVKSQGVRFKPIGVAQGWSPGSYAHAVSKLQSIGYDYIAMGGMVPLKTEDILATLSAVERIRSPNTRLHLLGVTRVSHIRQFGDHGVVSFDSTSPFLQAFKDEKDNYHMPSRAYSAIRVPQVEGSPKMRRLIGSGKVDQATARRLEQSCLSGLRSYDRGEIALEEIMETLEKYESLHSANLVKVERYREILEERPWKDCSCPICEALGIDIIIFRGSEWNKRRGFHNISVFRQKLTLETAVSPQSKSA